MARAASPNPAFPGAGIDAPGRSGMTLRDYFLSQATIPFSERAEVSPGNGVMAPLRRTTRRQMPCRPIGRRVDRIDKVRLMGGHVRVPWRPERKRRRPWPALSRTLTQQLRSRVRSKLAQRTDLKISLWQTRRFR